jgi:ribulose-5-phosphate 4-epimerase/fuculose-1-phosphate aldolase
MLEHMGDMPALVLRNHGLLTAAPTIAGAFVMMYFLEHACRSQVALLSMGQTLRLPLEEVCKHTAGQYWNGAVPPQRYGRESFAALMRRLDRIDPSYRD